MKKKIISLPIFTILAFFIAVVPTYAKQMNITEFGEEVVERNEGAEEVYIIGNYAFTSNHILTPQDLMLAARTIKVTDTTGEIDTDKIYGEMAIQRVVRTYDDTTHLPNGWKVVPNKEGKTPLPEQFNIRYIDYDIVEEDSHLNVTIDVKGQTYLETLNKYKFDEKYNGAPKLYSQDLQMSSSGKLTGLVRMNYKVDNTVYDDDNIRTGFYVPVVVTVPNATEETVIKVNTWWGSKTIAYNDFEVKDTKESGTVILLALNSTADNKTTTITVDIDGDGTAFAPASYTIDWTDLQFEVLLYNTIASLAKTDVGIDFSKTASETNGQGVLTIHSTLDDDYPIYYYRGKVNNNVIFNDLCWQVVRTTDDGGIRLIYNGKPDSYGRCNQTGRDAVSNGYSINTKYNDVRYDLYSPRDAGYTYNSEISLSTIKNVSGLAHMAATEVDSFRYASDVEYANGKYTLKNPITISRSLFGAEDNPYIGSGGITAGNIEQARKLVSEHPYTCIATSYVADGLTTCATVAYIVDVEPTFNSGAGLAKTGIIYYYTFSAGKKYDQSYIDSFSNHKKGANSTVKSSVDEFYASSIENNAKAKALIDSKAIYCNNRSVEDYGIFGLTDKYLGVKTRSFGSTLIDYTLLYKNFTNLSEGKTPTLACSTEDQYSTNLGNEFYYPIALLSADEANYAGVVFKNNNNGENSSTYLDSDIDYWVMTPAYFGPVSGGAPMKMMYITADGVFNTASVNSSHYAKPVITIKGTATYVDGDGTDINPYKIIL